MRVKSQRPNSLAGQLSLLRVNTCPGDAAIHRAKDTAAYFASLVSVTHKDFVTIAWIDQDTAEISEGEVTPSAGPARAIILRRIKGLLRSHVDAFRLLRILGDRVYGCVSRNPFDLPPAPTPIVRNEYAGGRGTYPNRLRLLEVC